MKKFNFLLALLLIMAAVIFLAACSGGGICMNHRDTDGDGTCNSCGEAITPDEDGGDGASDGDDGSLKPEGDQGFFLTKNGAAKVQFVVNIDSVNLNIYNRCKEIADSLGEYGIEMQVVADREATIKEYEILVGDISTRGEKYHYDYRALGPNGRAVELIDTKLIIAGGNESSLLEALAVFESEVIEKAADKNNIKTDTENSGHCYVLLHNKADYNWSGVSIADNDAKDYVIAADLSTKYEGEYLYRNIAEELQIIFYENSGYWFPIMDISKAESIPEHAIVIAYDKAVKDEGGFKILADDKTLSFITYYPAELRECIDKFMGHQLESSAFSVASGYSCKEELRYLTYEEYGAVGDGVANDYDALRKAHEHANKHDHIIVAEAGKNYRIGETKKMGAIPIRGDVIWTGATFTIDDSDITVESGEHIINAFSIASDYSAKNHGVESPIVKAVLEAGGLKTTTEKIPYSLGYPALLIPYDDNHKVYIRYGGNQNEGNPQHEIIVVDGEGNIDKDTPFLLDYSTVTSIREYRIDDKPITVDGGTFITVANRAACSYDYYARGISVSRSNVTIKNITHKIIGEGDTGAPYGGFISASNLNDLLVENCTFQAHRYYMNTSGVGGRTYMGTYEISGGASNKLVYKNCNQSNFMTFDKSSVNVNNYWYDIETGETGYRNDNPNAKAGIWGVMGTNYCKNLVYDNCKLNRFDAHAGVYNASIINGSETMMINLIGGGTALVKDSTVYNYNSLLTLRDDYGSTWNGEIVIDNVNFVTNSGAKLIQAIWVNWDFGYQVHLPNVTVNDLKISGAQNGSMYVFSQYTSSDFSASGSENPPVLPEYVRITNCGNIQFSLSTASSSLNGRIELTYPEEE